MDSQKRLARTAGLYYLVVAVLGAFAHVVRALVYVPGDAAASAENIVAKASLVNYSFVADLVQATFLVFVVMTLYRLLHHAGKNVARAMVIFVVIAVALICLNMVHQLGALLVATDSAYAAAFDSQGSEALVLLMLDLQHYGYLIAQIFFGLWLFPLGLLAIRSGMFPRLLGQLLMVASVGYLLDVALQFLAPEFADAVNPALVTLFVVAEGALLVYLLVRGVRTMRPAEQLIAAA
ncbi:DUF4386 domain-containing protein [Ornithinimicrobium cryptoxanthini]|uniref:DUF4386 domain-containing protein n=1 Tax=Ornithinimicrobium cryptoxanthini TaxID=2934161 RepID=A0ABY4YG93_9MICO|nr:DUF4386 domain-containing protein [Ornithinimicrobium cryptoxanthini]USQ75647.1 DUF4386 domain-containing protein [Ornithinimicrobium cryptoxanthini]